MTDAEVKEFGHRYAGAWSSGSPDAVVACFVPDGSLRINGGDPAVGPDAIRRVALDYMRSFPDLDVTCVGTIREGDSVRWHWRMRGTNLGAGGTGHTVDITGYEDLILTAGGLIESADGQFDEAEFERQLVHGV